MPDYIHVSIPNPYWPINYWSNWWPIGWSIPIVTPVYRTLSVETENRSLQIVFENRLIFPEPEVRTIYVDKQ